MLIGWTLQSGMVANSASVSRQQSSKASNAGISICMLYIFVRHEACAWQQHLQHGTGDEKFGMHRREVGPFVHFCVTASVQNRADVQIHMGHMAMKE